MQTIEEKRRKNAEWGRKYRETHREQYNAYVREYVRKRRERDPEFKERVCQAANKYSKHRYATDPEFRRHLIQYQQDYAKKTGYRAQHTCRARKDLFEHCLDLHNDPEHLSTEFIIDQIEQFKKSRNGQTQNNPRKKKATK